MTRQGTIWTAIALGVIGLGVLVYVLTGYPTQTRSLADLTGNAERGAYVIRLSGCIACHSTAETGEGYLSGGKPIETPFGNFTAPNITPDPTNGIGSWSLDQFGDALVNGRAPDGSHYYPVFPYTSYRNMTDQDIVDLWAYMQSVDPQSRTSPEHDLSFPFNMRGLMGAWKTLFTSSDQLSADPARNAQWNRGAYLVNGPSHCGECHSPRGLFGNQSDPPLSGSDTGPGGEQIPAISAEALTQNGWSKDNLGFGLKLGMMPDGDFLGGSMGEVIKDGTSHFTDEDIAAIATYLLSGEE